MSIDNNEKMNLYVLTDYLKMPDSFLDELRLTNVFHSVTHMDYSVFYREFAPELKATEGLTESEVDVIGNSLFEKYLVPYFSDLFANADKDDEMQIFHDLGWFWYYVEKNFDNIVVVEDGYRAFEQYVKVQTPTGLYPLLAPFIAKYHPPHMFTSEKINKIISSCDFPELDTSYRKKLVVSDYLEEINRNKDEFTKIITKLFKFEGIDIDGKSVLYLTQPLDRSTYCTARQYYKLNKKIIGSEVDDGYKVYIKPHPAERINFKLFTNDNVIQLPQSLPAEVINYSGIEFDKGLTFHSTSLRLMNNVKTKEVMLDVEELTRSSVNAFLKKFVGDTTINISFYLKITELTPENYINVFSFFHAVNGLSSRVIVMVPIELLEVAENYFKVEEMPKMIKAYYAYRKDHEAILWRKEIKDLLKINRFDITKNLSVVGLNDFSEKSMINAIESKNATFDYYAIIEEGNLGIPIMRSLKKTYSKQIPNMIFCNEYISHGSRRVELAGEFFNGYCSNKVTNIIRHRSIDPMTLPENEDVYCFEEDTEHNPYTFALMQNCEMLSDGTEYVQIADGNEYYRNKILNTLKDIADYSKCDLENKITVILIEYINWMQLNDVTTYADSLFDLYNVGGMDVEIISCAVINVLHIYVLDKRYRSNRNFSKFKATYYYTQKVNKYLYNTLFYRILISSFRRKQRTTFREGIKKIKMKTKRKLKRIIKKYLVQSK
jgi:hypothetical protein